MITLKIALVAMMMSSTVVPLHNESLNMPVDYQRAPEVVGYTISNEILPASDIGPVPEDIGAIDSGKEEASVTQTVNEDKPVAQTINEDKTYEQCAKEAFDYIYEEVNRLLEKCADYPDELWLQKKA